MIATIEAKVCRAAPALPDRKQSINGFPEQMPPSDLSLLRAAQTAMERGDLQRADALFLQHFEQARDDAIGLGNYGDFCLRTGRAASACYLLYKANAVRPGNGELLSALGYARLEVSDFEAAKTSFEAALVLLPGHTLATYGLALCHQQNGAWSDAVAAFAKVSAVQPDALPILLNLATACHRAGEMAQARTQFEHAERIAPDDPAMLLEYGKFLREQGEAARAMQLVDRLAQLRPDEPQTILEKARCLRALGDPTQAMRWLERLEERSPGLPESAVEYGNCLQGPAQTEQREFHWGIAAGIWVKTGEFTLAEALLDRLLAANPLSAAGWNSRGLLEFARERLDAAEAAYQKAIESDPATLDAPANLAQLYEKTNRIAEASATAENALRFARAGEQHAAAIELHLVVCRVARRQQDYAYGLHLLECIDALGPDDLQRQFASFERGRLMDLQDDVSHAIEAFTLGNALALEPWLSQNPGKNKSLNGVDYMLDLVGKGWLQQWKPTGALRLARKQAFLFGFPRSGTTLLNQVLDSHNAIQTMEEKPPVSRIMAAVRSMPKGYPHALPELDALDIAYLREAYFQSAAKYGACDPSKLAIDKFPMHITLANLLHRVFPTAKFVLALRHPCDVVLSCFMQNFRLNDAMANFCTLADTVMMYTHTMDLWEAYRQQLPLTVHTIRYEDVVDDFDGQVRALCAFLDVPWEDSLRQFASKALDRGKINTPSYEQVSKPIYREARYRWERYRDHLAPYLPTLRPYIERFGYADPAQPG